MNVFQMFHAPWDRGEKKRRKLWGDEVKLVCLPVAGLASINQALSLHT